jgi:hypothetical protein
MPAWRRFALITSSRLVWKKKVPPTWRVRARGVGRSASRVGGGPIHVDCVKPARHNRRCVKRRAEIRDTNACRGGGGGWEKRAGLWTSSARSPPPCLCLANTWHPPSRLLLTDSHATRPNHSAPVGIENIFLAGKPFAAAMTCPIRLIAGKSRAGSCVAPGTRPNTVETWHPPGPERYPAVSMPLIQADCAGWGGGGKCVPSQSFRAQGRLRLKAARRLAI